MKKQDNEDAEAWGKRKLDLLQAKHVDHNPDANLNQLKRDSPAGVGVRTALPLTTAGAEPRGRGVTLLGYG